METSEPKVVGAKRLKITMKVVAPRVGVHASSLIPHKAGASPENLIPHKQ